MKGYQICRDGFIWRDSRAFLPDEQASFANDCTSYKVGKISNQYATTSFREYLKANRCNINLRKATSICKKELGWKRELTSWKPYLTVLLFYNITTCFSCNDSKQR